MIYTQSVSDWKFGFFFIIEWIKMGKSSATINT